MSFKHEIFPDSLKIAIVTTYRKTKYFFKQVSFQTGHSTDHAIIQLVYQIYEGFKENKYTLGVFIDVTKASDTVDHKILIKIEIYGIGRITLK